MSAEEIDHDQAATGILVVRLAGGLARRQGQLEARPVVFGARPRALTLTAKQLIEDVRGDHDQDMFMIRARRDGAHEM